MTENYTILIDPMITLSSIKPFYTSCKEASGASAVIVNASQVEWLCTPVFQLLISLKKTLEKDNKHFQISQPSEAFLSMLNILGLQNILEIKNEVAA